MDSAKYKEEFLLGITKLTGLPYKKVASYAKENNPFNILQHPRTIEPNDKQLQKIGLLNEFISTYNVLKIYEDENKIALNSSSTAGKYFSSLLSGVRDKEKFLVAFLDKGNHIIETRVLSEGTVEQALRPSIQDEELTQRLVDIFHPLGIHVVGTSEARTFSS
jgi:DNA repair protein RadC